MTSPSDGYMLGRGLGPSIRLLTQHWLWKNLYGWNLYPEAGKEQEESGQPQKIADLATGNAIWLIEEAIRNPSNIYIGLDINESQFPPKDTLPDNVTLQVLDATAAVPEEYVGAFDAVHIRLLVPAVRGNDPRPILHNTMTMLKPGGFLQWGEIIPRSTTLGRPGHVSAAQKIISGMLSKMGSLMEIEENWISRLPRIFEESGLSSVECFKMGQPRKEMWMYWGENCAGAMEELSMAGNMGKEYLIEMARERQKGELAFLEPQIVVGWKGRKSG